MRSPHVGPLLFCSWGPTAWSLVMAIIGGVQLVRQQWFAAALFLLAALVLGVDLVRRLRRQMAAGGARASVDTAGRSSSPTPDRRATDRTENLPRVVLLPAAAAVAAVLVALPRHSGAMVATLVPVGVVVLVLGWPGDRTPGRPRRWSPGLRRLAATWAGIWIAAGLWELAQVLLVNLGHDLGAAPLSDLLDPALEHRLGQGVFAALWLLAGVYLLRRGRED